MASCSSTSRPSSSTRTRRTTVRFRRTCATTFGSTWNAATFRAGSSTSSVPRVERRWPSRSHANFEDCARVAQGASWRVRRRTWWTASCRQRQCGSTCWPFRTSCPVSRPPDPMSFARFRTSSGRRYVGATCARPSAPGWPRRGETGAVTGVHRAGASLNVPAPDDHARAIVPLPRASSVLGGALVAASRGPRRLPRQEGWTRPHPATRDVAHRMPRSPGGDGASAALPTAAAAWGAGGTPGKRSARSAPAARIACR